MMYCERCGESVLVNPLTCDLIPHPKNCASRILERATSGGRKLYDEILYLQTEVKRLIDQNQDLMKSLQEQWARYFAQQARHLESEKDLEACLRDLARTRYMLDQISPHGVPGSCPSDCRRCLLEAIPASMAKGGPSKPVKPIKEDGDLMGRHPNRS